AVVTHDEVAAGRYGQWAERTYCGNLRREHHFMGQAGEILLDHNRAALLVVILQCDLLHLRRPPVHEELVVAHLNVIAGHSHHTLYESRAIDRRKEDDDVAALR